MGLFWSYFRDTLRFPAILRQGPLAMLAEGGAAVLDDVRGVILQLREQFFPEKCEEVLLTRYAKSRGIVRAPLETEEYWKARVRFAYLWWARGGRASSMEQTLVKFFDFASAAVISLRDEDPTRWAEFRVELEVLGGTLSISQEQIEWGINEIKRASAKLAEVVYTYSSEGAVPVIGISLQSTEIVTIYPLPQ